VGLGSNLGDRLANLQEAVDRLGRTPGVQVVQTSRVYETDPVGPPQPDYLNAVVMVRSSLSARELLEACLAIERAMGRERGERWGPRSIDLDVLQYGREQIDEPGLQVPHPRMHERGFVLVPLLELEATPELPAGRRLEDLRLGAGMLSGVRPFAPALRVPRPTVAVIGAGRVATALAVRWVGAGYRVVAATGREASRERAERFLSMARFYPPESAHQGARFAELVVLGVPDDLIADVCAQLAERKAFRSEQYVLHLSGSVGLDALSSAQVLGAEVLSLHPLQSFPDVEEGIARLPESFIAVTAWNDQAFTYGEDLARDAGGLPFRLADEAKPLYHAAAVFCSNYLVAVEGMAEHLFRLAGLKDPLDSFQPLARTTFESTFAVGPEGALTGPAVRGDTGTIARNLAALAERAPEAVPAYVALARVAASLAVRSGRLTSEGRARVEEVLRRWT
jgi:2-amino-4-hydroxy-6-hydroxymethyldihydropteridine diphosphokinase